MQWGDLFQISQLSYLLDILMAILKLRKALLLPYTFTQQRRMNIPLPSQLSLRGLCSHWVLYVKSYGLIEEMLGIIAETLISFVCMLLLWMQTGATPVGCAETYTPARAMHPLVTVPQYSQPFSLLYWQTLVMLCFVHGIIILSALPQVVRRSRCSHGVKRQGMIDTLASIWEKEAEKHTQ